MAATPADFTTISFVKLNLPLEIPVSELRLLTVD